MDVNYLTTILNHETRSLSDREQNYQQVVQHLTEELELLQEQEAGHLEIACEGQTTSAARPAGRGGTSGAGKG